MDGMQIVLALDPDLSKRFFSRGVSDAEKQLLVSVQSMRLLRTLARHQEATHLTIELGTPESKSKGPKP